MFYKELFSRFCDALKLEHLIQPSHCWHESNMPTVFFHDGISIKKYRVHGRTAFERLITDFTVLCYFPDSKLRRAITTVGAESIVRTEATQVKKGVHSFTAASPVWFQDSPLMMHPRFWFQSHWWYIRTRQTYFWKPWNFSETTKTCQLDSNSFQDWNAHRNDSQSTSWDPTFGQDKTSPFSEANIRQMLNAFFRSALQITNCMQCFCLTPTFKLKTHTLEGPASPKVDIYKTPSAWHYSNLSNRVWHFIYRLCVKRATISNKTCHFQPVSQEKQRCCSYLRSPKTHKVSLRSETKKRGAVRYVEIVQDFPQTEQNSQFG